MTSKEIQNYMLLFDVITVFIYLEQTPQIKFTYYI